MSQMTQRKQTKTLPYRDRLILSVLLLALSLWSQPKTAQAQWQSGTDMYNLNTGNVGIGSGSSFTPAEKLDVRGNLNLGTVGLTSTLKIYSSAAGGTGSYGRILTRPSGGLEVIGGGGSAATENVFYVTANEYPGLDNTYGLGLTSLRWNNLQIGTGTSSFAGFVGIGTTTPGTALEVFRNTTGIATFRTDTVDGEINLYAGGQTAENRRFGIYNTGTTFRIRALNDAYNNAADALVITRSNLSVSNIYFPNGNVGIGTTGPGHKLEVNQSTDDKLVAYFKSTAPTIGSKVGVLIDAGSDASDYALYLRNATGSLAHMIVRGNGNVGIGTTSPGEKLHIAGNIDTTDGADRKLTLRSSTNYNYALQTTGNNFQIIEAPGSSNAVRLHISYPNGNIGIGTSTPDSTKKLHVAGDVRIDGNIAAKYQDVAEWVTSPKAMPAGTVVILHPEQTNQVLPSMKAYDTRVAGVISDMPGLLLGEAGDGKVKVATTGRVKVKVDATKKPVQVGDLLVTSDKEGVAMKSEPLDLGGVPIHRPGTLIGKALEPLKEGEGEILVLLSLQ